MNYFVRTTAAHRPSRATTARIASAFSIWKTAPRPLYVTEAYLQCYDRFLPRRPRKSGLLIAVFALVFGSSAMASSPCDEALAGHTVCESANAIAFDAMKSRRLRAVSVVQDVATGALVVFAASEPSKLDVSTQVLPLSLAKVFLAASCWDRQRPDQQVHEMVAGGNDSIGKQVAIALRRRPEPQRWSPISADTASTEAASPSGLKLTRSGRSALTRNPPSPRSPISATRNGVRCFPLAKAI